ncbi:MAG: MotA/TolQ/ExbB proton channel family protein [Ignavibacteriales bacterium]|nr:MotA/TolQ/ExbB proton channel family protein [Ignavibacteriales bacterium]
MNLLSLFEQGGLLMYPILLCSIIAGVVIIERALVLRKAKTDIGQFMMRLRSVMQRGGVLAGLNFCSKSDAPIAKILKRGLTKYQDGHERVREAIENAGKEEAFQLEHRLGILASVAGIAPLIGFLGTVTGMITAFRSIEQLGGAVNPSLLAGGIWEALLTTAFGLFVGIPAFGFYNYYVTKVGRFVFEMESASEEFLDLVRSGKVEEGAETGKGLGSAEALGDEEFFTKKG